MPEVAAFRTPLPWSEIERAIRALPDLTPTITPKAVPYLLAMAALENGAKGDGIWNHNWGNITTADASLPYFHLDDPELRKFMHFNSHAEGLHAWVNRLFSPTHKRIIFAANEGDFDAFFAGITLPHPETMMAYCPDCASSKTRATYLGLVKKFGGSRRGGGGAAWLLGALALTGLGAWMWRRR